MPTKIDQFKGKPTITLDPESRYPFTFGLHKAKLILDSVEEIKAFVQRFDTEPAAEKLPSDLKV